MDSGDTSSPSFSDLGLLRKFLFYLKPYKKPLRVVYVLHFINALLNLMPAFSLKYYFDLVVAPRPVRLLGIRMDTTELVTTPTDKLIGTGIYFVGMVGLIIVANWVGVVMWRLGTKLTQQLLLDIKTHIVHHLHKLSLSYFHKEQTGGIMTRAVGDVMQMQQMMMNSFHLTYSLVQMLLAPLLMITMSWQLFLFCLIPIPIIVLVIRRIRSRLRPLYRQQREKQAEVDSAIQEQISGIREIKAFGQEDTAREEITRANEAYRDKVNEAMKIFSVNHQILHGTGDFAMVLVASAAGFLIAASYGLVTLGTVLSFLPLMSMFFNPFRQLSRFYDVFQRGLASTERVFEFFEVEPDLHDAPHARWEDLSAGRVTFENVTFGYDPNQPVLHGIDLDVQPGQTIAIVGSTGSGKSTLASLIPRFYDPQAGRILIDGHPLENIKMECLREAVGIVFQETFLFYGTIAQNISFSRPDASHEQIVDAARRANIHQFIESLPDGYHSRIGERGVNLSGGQRQRLAIARMILKNPSIIILDEATSALDTTTERLIQESMDRLMQGRTSFVIAHRLSTIRRADRIVVMEDGRIVETGTHDQLVDRGGRYAQLASVVA